MCVNISLYLGVQPRFHDGSLLCRKQSRYPPTAGMSWSNDVETTSVTSIQRCFNVV